MKTVFSQCWLLSLILFSSAVNAVTQAYVDAGEVGQGFLLKRLDTCYLVSPAHVIGDEFYAAIKTNSKHRSAGEAQSLETFAYDLTLLSVEGAAKKDCQTHIGAFKSIDSLLGAVTTLNLNAVNPDGSQSYVPVDLMDVGIQYIRVKARSADFPLYKGLSGSMVYFEETPVGILQSIDSQTNEGIVLRIDRVIAVIQPFFTADTSSEQLIKKSLRTTSSGERNSISMVALSWSEPPLNADHRLSYLFDNNPETQWGVNFSGQPLYIEIQLAEGNKAIRFDQLRMQVAMKEAKTMPKDFEVLVSRTSTGNRGWISVLSGTWLKNAAEKQVSFAPVKAKRLKIVFYSNWGADKVKVSSISVY